MPALWDYRMGAIEAQGESGQDCPPHREEVRLRRMPAGMPALQARRARTLAVAALKAPAQGRDGPKARTPTARADPP